MGIYAEVESERLRAEVQHGDQGYRRDSSPRIGDHPYSVDVIRSACLVRSWVDWLHAHADERLGYDLILLEEVAEAIDEARAGNTAELRSELIQVAATAVSWVRTIDGRTA